MKGRECHYTGLESVNNAAKRPRLCSAHGEETLWWLRGLLKIPMNYMGFKAETNDLRSTHATRAKGPPAGMTASLRCAPKLQRLCSRRSNERGTGRR